MRAGQYGPPNDFLYYAPWNVTDIIEGCQSSLLVTPRPYWIRIAFGGYDIQVCSHSLSIGLLFVGFRFRCDVYSMPND